MSTQRYKDLKVEINRIRRHFLPTRWDPTGTYSERIVDRARAFKVLAHAEIEYYIEQVLLDKVKARYQEWTTGKKPSTLMTCLLAAGKFRFRDDESEKLEGYEPLDTFPKIKENDDSIHDLIDRSVKQYEELVKNNNGIKTKNLKSLILPMGILLSELDSVWLGSMNSFGFQRGAFAHSSRRSFSLTSLPDPKTEWDTVQNLLLGLKTLDEKIEAM